MIELISVHIPKTAGTAFRHVLTDVYGLDGVLGDYPPDNVHQLEQPLAKGIKVIHGHFAPSKYQDRFSEAKRIVWLRHPIFRLISEYFFAKTINDRQNAIHAQLLEKNLDILDFARIPAMRNFLSHKIEGLPLAQFDFVGVQEFYLEDLADLKQLMGWQDFQPIVKNSNRFPEYFKCLQTILGDRQLMDSLAKLNQQDLELYQEALYLRAKRSQQSVLIQSTLADWQRSQYLLAQIQTELNQTRSELQQLNHWLKQNSQRSQNWHLKLMAKSKFSHLLAGCHIDSPQAVIPHDSHKITVSGWAIGQNSLATTMRIVAHNQTICETPINLPRPDVAQVYPVPNAKNSGFNTELVVSAISPQAKLFLTILLADGTQVVIGSISSPSLPILNL